MKYKEIPPVRIPTKYLDLIEEMISEIFRIEIYRPLVNLLEYKSTSIKNSNSDYLLEAIQSGRITFYRGHFKGKFNARISRELRKRGATWDRKNKSYRLSKSKLSAEMEIAISSTVDRFSRTMAKIKQRLEKILPEEIADRLNAVPLFDKMIYETNAKVADSIRGITVGSDLSEKARLKLAEEYTENLRRDIKGWAEYEVLNLRKVVESQSLQGFRYEGMAKQIEARYGVSKSKAKFLARQETNLMLAKFKESRYADAGVTEYIWKTVVGSSNHPVRPMHKALDGKKFSWNAPPVTDIKGSRNNPGEDYNCRCYAKPIVRF